MIYGERIKQVREMHRMTQADLVKEVPGLTQSRLSRIEKDLAPLDPESVALIASVTGVANDFFYRPPIESLSALSPQLRSRSRLTQGEKAAALQWARLIDEEYQSLRRQARQIPITLRRTNESAIEQAAANTRELLGFSPEEPLPYLLLAVERVGVTVLGLPYAIDTLDAFCAWRADEPVIAILDGVPADRLRFNVAHELGHLVLHQPGQVGQEIEAEADRFASELLTPLRAIRKVMPRNPTLSALVMLKTHWGVSVKSLVRRARELGAIDGDRALSLYKQISARGWNKKEPGYVAREKPRALRKMAEIAYGPGVSTERLAEKAGWSEQLALEILSQHASVDELPHESHLRPSPLRIDNLPRESHSRAAPPSNVIPLRRQVLHSTG